MFDYIPSTAGMSQHWVQGKKASLNEFNVATALARLGIAFQFQYTLWGGIGFRGGVSIDFMTQPFGMPIEVLGERWHKGSMGADDRIRMHRITEAVGRVPIQIWGEESATVEMAYTVIKERYRAPI